MVVRCPLVCVFDRCCVVSLCFAVIFVPYIRMDRLFCFCDCRLGWFSFNLVMSIYGVVTVVDKYLHVKRFLAAIFMFVNGSRFFDWFNMDINLSHVQKALFFRRIALVRLRCAVICSVIRMDRPFCFCDHRLVWFSFNLVMRICGVVTPYDVKVCFLGLHGLLHFSVAQSSFFP